MALVLLRCRPSAGYRFLPWLSPPAAHARPRFGPGDPLFERRPAGRWADLLGELLGKLKRPLL